MPRTNQKPTTPKVSALTSLGAKLFCYMTLLVLITIVGNSFQYVRAFMTYQTQQVQDSIQVTAERASSQVESAIDAWRAQIAVALPTLKGGEDGADPEVLNEQVRRFVDSSHEFVGFMMLGAPSGGSTTFTKNGEAFTSYGNDPRFEGKVPAEIYQGIRTAALKWLRRDVPRSHKGNNVLVESFAKTLDLPIMMTAVRFEVTDSKRVMWAVLATWQSSLIKALPKSKLIEGTVIDTHGKVFTSPNISDMTSRKQFPGNRLVKAALSATSPAGFEPEYRTEGAKRRLGAYARLPKYGLTILVESDAELAYQALKRNLYSTALWASLFILLAVMFAYLGSQTITKNLREVTTATERIAAGDFNHQLKLKSKDEIAQLAVSVNHMAQKIVGLMKNQVEKARIEQELETARMVQGTFFPRADIRKGPLFVTGFYQPATECGGDLWGHFTIRPGVEFLFVADAMGHGAPAAMVTAMAYATTMTIADIMRDTPDLSSSPALVLARTNRILFEAVRGTISMTAFAAVVDTNRGRITYANAGHNFPFIIPLDVNDERAGKSSAARAKKTGKAQPISLKQMGTPLGMAADSTFADSESELRAGDKIFLFTDGLIECSAPSGAVWGRKELLLQAADTANLPAEEMRDELLGRAFSFFANKPLEDDVTVVIAEIDKTWKRRSDLQTIVSKDIFSASAVSSSALRVPVAQDTPPPRAPMPTPPPQQTQPPVPPWMPEKSLPRDSTADQSAPQRQAGAPASQPVARHEVTTPPSQPVARHEVTTPPSQLVARHEVTTPPSQPVARHEVTTPPSQPPTARQAVSQPAPPPRHATAQAAPPPRAPRQDVEGPAHGAAPEPMHPRPHAGVSQPLPLQTRPIPSSPTSSPAPAPLGKNGKYKIKLPRIG